MTLSLNKTSYRFKAEQIKEELINWRRYLHQNPELAFEEENTQHFIQTKLKDFGIESKPIAKTGVVALIKGNEEGPTFALRADMDALPIQEENDVPYISKIKGKAHMCGHDSHVAMLLGTAKLLAENPPNKGNVKLIFQPAEEIGGGAKAMVEEGVLLDPKVDAIAALHVYAKLPTGEITSERGISCAATDFFDVEIKSEGGHAAHPHLTVDPITTTAAVISSIQHIVSRQIDPLSPAVVTIGQIHGGNASNVIPSSVTFSGTVRTLDPAVRESMEERLDQIINGVTKAHGASYKLTYNYFFPSAVHDDELIPLLEETAREVLGEGKLTFSKPSMGGEDFSYFTEKVPAITFRLGVGNEVKGTTNSLHHPKFNIDEDALEIGAAMLAQIAANYLSKEDKNE
jgi:amidohydrolase